MKRKRPRGSKERVLALMEQGRYEEARRALNTVLLKLNPVSGPRQNEFSATLAATSIARHLAVPAGCYLEAELTSDPDTSNHIVVLRPASREWFHGPGCTES